MTRRITGAGTPATTWTQWLAAAPVTPLEDDLPGPGDEVLVVAAHPDDEVLGVGGLLRVLADRGASLRLVWATDGEASHPDQPGPWRADLAGRRRREAVRGLDRLGVHPAATTWLGLPDSGLADASASLAQRLCPLVVGSTLVIAPWSSDGHPDHEACGHVARRVALCAGVPVLEYPVWMWDWGHPDDALPWDRARTVALPPGAREAKHAAARAHHSQVRPAPGDREPVLPDRVLAHFDRDVEVVFR